MIRYFLARGDRAGSATIIEGLSNVTCSNPPPSVQIATLYMKTYCTACKREGFIAPKGPRHKGSGPNGKPWALSGDVNICGCNPPPVFYAVRAMKMTFTSEELAQMNAPVAPAYVPQRADTQEYAHEKRTLADEETSLTDDPELICPNMSNAEFHALVMKCRDGALGLIRERQPELVRWSSADRARVKKWFGTEDESVRAMLIQGLPKLLSAMQELKPENIIRHSEEARRNISCIPVNNIENTEASVCKPDSRRRIISIYPKFCTLPDSTLWNNCKVKTLSHECTHYVDVFDSEDEIYGYGIGLSLWAQNNPEKAARNADNITNYIAHDDERRLWW